ncbi:MAG: EamA family transporter [Alphaproteobacteria bacterium]|nr:EamA family transporter [Alphaproteobacteria bacterium]
MLDPLVIALLLAAAVMHASWNAILKSDRADRLATFGVIMAMGALQGAILVPFLPMIDPAAWKWAACSVAAHLLYYVFLLKAYAYGDLSHAYPIARGSGPLLVAVFSGRLLGEALRSQDVLGVVLLSAGLIALALPERDGRATGEASPGARRRHRLATLFALLTGVTIALYIVADGLGVRAAGPTLEHKISYIAWLNLLEGPWLLLFAIWRRPRAVVGYLRTNWHRGVAGGLVAHGGYGIAIWALSQGPMAHVAALRETSVLFGALMGALLLGESFGRRRVAAAAVIVAGLVLMNAPRLF